MEEERDLERIDRESFECGRRNSIGNSVRDGIPFNGSQRLLPCPLVTIDSNTSDQLLTDRGVSCLSLAGQFVRCCCADVCACEFRCCRQAADSDTHTHSHWEWGNTNTVSERAISQRIHTHRMRIPFVILVKCFLFVYSLHDATTFYFSLKYGNNILLLPSCCCTQ